MNTELKNAVKAAGGIYDYLTQKEETIEYGVKKCSTGNRQRRTI